MDSIKNYKLIILLLIPFFLGWLFNSFSPLLTIYVKGFWLISIGFIIYWLWVGKQFGQLKNNKLTNFLIGNILWAISLGLFIWQFIFLDDLNRNLFIAGISQHYSLFTIAPASRIIMLFQKDIHSTQIIVTSYIFMIIIFTIGFIYGATRHSKTYSNDNFINKS